MKHPFRKRSAVVLSALMPAGMALSALAGPASADPATSVGYPSGATATRYVGLAFDACNAPPLTAIKAWGASPYRAVAIYLSGVNRFCAAQPELTPTWVTEVSKLKWRLIPIHKGLQPPCGGKPTDQKITLSGAVAQGTSAASEAVGRAKALGILPGSAVYNDIEHYSSTDSNCRTAVLRYLSGWTRELHRLGYLSGVYVNLSSGVPDLSTAYTSTSYARPDAVWIARYDGVSSLTKWAGVADAKWAVHQRGKQYKGSHTETYGGVTINIDNDLFDAPVATVALPYTVVGTTTLNARSGPATSYSTVRTHASGVTLRVVCQTPGSKVFTTPVWDKLSDGTYVSDRYVNTYSSTGYSAPLPRCSYPYQATATGGLTQRTGPGTSYATRGSLPNGALAWIVCQKVGSKVGTTRIWDKLDNNRWVSDYQVATRSNLTYSKPIPRC